MAKKILERLSNTKTRILALLGVMILIVVIVIVMVSSRKPNPLETDVAKTGKIPEITSIPGNVTSERYRELQEEDNRRRAAEAKKQGTSAVATIIGTQGNSANLKRETFGIEDQFLKTGGTCKCPETGPIPTLETTLADKLIAQIEANPADAARLLLANPGLAKSLCLKKPDLAMQVAEKDPEAAKVLLKECPDMAKKLAEKDPALFKKLMLENPELAKQLAASNPELFKKLMREDPAFANALAKSSPDVVKDLMKNDSEFADQMGKQNPDMVKALMRADPAFAKIMAKNNAALVKSLMLSDPDFARAMATANPDMVKDLMRGDPAFARALAKSNPGLVKDLMRNDPAFAREMEAANPDMVNELMKNDPEFARAMANQKKGAPLTDKERLAALEEARRKQQASQAEISKQTQLNDLQQKQLAALLAAMDGQSKDILKAWNVVNEQAFVQGEWAKKKDSSGGAPSGPEGSMPPPPLGNPGENAPPATVIFKAGTILYAVLDTAVNTDEPGPIMATIVEGKLKGAKAIGSVQFAIQPGGGGGGRPEKVTLNFSLLNIPSAPNSISFKAVAIDPETARTAIASDVDHHYLLRYGALFASSFLVGYAKVITSEGSTQTNATNGLATTTSLPQLSPRKEVFAALGEVGKAFGDAASTYFMTPNTITVDEGTGFGMLILSDVAV